EIVPHAMPVVELKVPLDPALLGGIFQRHNALQDALVISFEPAWLTGLRKSYRDLSVGLLSDTWRDDLLTRAAKIGAEVLALNVEALGLERVEAAKNAGLEFWTYTANDVGLVAACAAMGVTGIITDRPDLIRMKSDDSQ